LVSDGYIEGAYKHETTKEDKTPAMQTSWMAFQEPLIGFMDGYSIGNNTDMAGNDMQNVRMH